jgi:salicylate hydroxylase
MENESAPIPIPLAINPDNLTKTQSIVKSAFNDPGTLRQAPYRIFRAIVPTETLLTDEGQPSMLSLTTGKFAIFAEGKRVLSWFEGRE